MSVRFEMRLPDEMAIAIDRVRGNEPRAAWIKRTLAAALSGSGGGSDGESKVARAALPEYVSKDGSAPQRAPVPTCADGQRLWPCPRAQCRQMGVAGERCPIDTHLTFKEG